MRLCIARMLHREQGDATFELDFSSSRTWPACASPFETNYASGKHQFAFLAYHMFTMSFVYFNIWQIKQNRPTDFIKATYGFSKDNEDTVLSATSPFTFSEISESAIFRSLKLIECDNSKIGHYTKLVKDRNASAILTESSSTPLKRRSISRC